MVNDGDNDPLTVKTLKLIHLRFVNQKSKVKKINFRLQNTSLKKTIILKN